MNMQIEGLLPQKERCGCTALLRLHRSNHLVAMSLVESCKLRKFLHTVESIPHLSYNLGLGKEPTGPKADQKGNLFF
jgi:hypothetical protein